MPLKLAAGIQEALVAILLYDPKGSKVAAGLIPAQSYDIHYRDLVEAAVSYLDQYGRPAGDHALELVEDLKSKRPKSKAIYSRLYESLQVYEPLIRGKDPSFNPEYIFKQAGVFARAQRLRDGLGQAVDAIEKDTAESVEEAETALRSALEFSWQAFDPGTYFADTERSLRFLTEPRVAMSTGIPALDYYGLGPARKELHILAADTGGGKSWWLIHLTKMALLARLRVLYISLELSERELMQRLAQAFFAVTKRKEDVTRRRIKTDKKGAVKGLSEQVLTKRPALTDANILGILQAKVAGFKRRPPLLVKEFPAGTLTIRQLRAYLASLEGSAKFLPDLICLDYPDEMEHDPKNKRLELIKIFTDLRGIATERNVAMATVTQLNETGAKARTATKHDLAEAKGKAHKADVLLTLSMTEEEKALGLARIFVAKGRMDRDGFQVLISRSLALGQFVVDSARMSKEYWGMVEKPDDVPEEDEVDAAD